MKIASEVEQFMKKINWHLVHDLLKTTLLAILVVYAAVNYENHQNESKQCDSYVADKEIMV